MVEEIAQLQLREWPTLRKQLAMLLLPDLNEILLLIIGLTINFTIFPLIFSKEAFLDSINQFNTTSLGMLFLTFFGYRWGYSSLSEAVNKRKKAEENHMKGQDLIVEFKIFGLSLGLFFFIGGLFYLDEVIVIVGPVVSFVNLFI